MHTPASRLVGAQWRKSRYSGKLGNCVELAPVGDSRVAVRNSRFPDEAALLLTRSDLGSLIAEVKAGGFDDLLEGA
ncbi:MAG: hypothetical protein QOE59_4590 [Actinomycetota bacterium]|jgi:hypothetical protein|nr:hypothetical protein [Actinomycetota bacterium]